MATSRGSSAQVQELKIPAGGVMLSADVAIPLGARGLVLFAHGSGSSRKSPRNRFVADELQVGGFATVLMDLLTPEEEVVDDLTSEMRFDIDLLAGRLGHAARWLASYQPTGALPLGCFGASTGGGAALVAAAAEPKLIRAVVSRGGRPDLAGADALANVRAPTLLIVGGDDSIVIELNRTALDLMRCERRLEIVPGASHLFEEPGKLERVAQLANDWLAQYLAPEPS